MQRRKRWTMLALVLLPSLIGITTLSVIDLASEPTPAPPAVAPASPPPSVTESPPALEAAPASPPEASPPTDTFEPEASEADPEQRPLVPTTMLADVGPAPSFETDSFAPDISFMSSGSGLRFGQTLSMSRGGGFAGGASGRGPGSGSVPSGDTDDDVGSGVEDLLTRDGDREAQSEPTLPETPAPKGPEQEILVADLTNPSDAPAIPPYDLIAPISGGSDGEESKPHVSVPEPSTWGLFGIALLGAVIGRRRRPGVSQI